jgi:hypothetical protein
VLHEEWPAGVFPLRKDFDPTIAVPSMDNPMEPMYHLRGDGIVEIPVGPIHAGVIEPGHFRFAAVGEQRQGRQGRQRRQAAQARPEAGGAG